MQMKSYLDLIPVSTKLHRRQTRMTRLCIVLSVFLITAIFSMADMFLRSQKLQAIQANGSWHAAFKDLTEEQMAIIEARPDVKSAGRYAVTNYRLDMGYHVGGTQTAICGFDEAFLSMLPSIEIQSGSFPQSNEEALVSESMRERLGVEIGDVISLEGNEAASNANHLANKYAREYKITGFFQDTSDLQRGGAFGICLNADAYMDSFQHITSENSFEYFVEFAPHCKIQHSVEDICNGLNISKDSVSENTKLIALLLQSSDGYIETIYLVAIVLAVLVAFSGMLMILGSMNSNVAQRTEFFGMMRCIGATPRQVRKFVRAEALSWCKSAIPAGLVCSIVLVWGLCAMLEHMSQTYFGEMPNYGISGIGVFSGCVIGLLTVLIAARSPAKKASKASPLAAVSGNAGTVFAAGKVFSKRRHAAYNRKIHIETALGIHHATGSWKNLLLLTCSFGFSIILFLSFSIGIDFMHHSLTPLRPYTPDVSIVGPENTCLIPDTLFSELQKSPYIKRIFGRSFAYNLPVKLNGKAKTVNLISYEKYQFNWAQEDLVNGSIEDAKKGKGVLIMNGARFPVKKEDTACLTTNLGKFNLKISGVLSYVPYSNGTADATLICSEALFHKLTGESGYTILDIQLENESDFAVSEIRETAGDGFTFSDRRASNHEVRAVYVSFALFVYGFLAIVALIAAFNMINTTQMSLAARMKQYGAMRAIGTSLRQLNRMVIAEIATYCFGGLLIGCGLGIPVHRLLYREVITSRWGDLWSFPFGMLILIVLVMLAAAVAAVLRPLNRLKRMSVIDTIGAQ